MRSITFNALIFIKLLVIIADTWLNKITVVIYHGKLYFSSNTMGAMPAMGFYFYIVCLYLIL